MNPLDTRAPINQAEGSSWLAFEPAKDDTHTSGTSSMKTLVVDDDPVIRTYVESVVSSQGHHVVSFPDGESAWEAIRAESFSLIILDWKLPGMDGLELCRKVRQLPMGDQSMIVMISGAVDSGDIQALLNAGADDFIAKPLNPEHLKLILRLAERQAKRLSQLKEHSIRLGIVETIAKAVGSTLEPKELFSTIVREIRGAVPCDRCGITRLSEGSTGSRHLHFEADPGLGHIPIREDELGEWYAREVYEQKQPLLIGDLREEPLLVFESLKQIGLRSLLVIPILQDEACIAHLELAARDTHAFSSGHIELLTAIASHLGSAIRNATLFHTAEKRASRLSALQDLNRQIAENLNLPEVLENITSAAVELLRADFSQIYLVDEKSEHLQLIKWKGYVPPPPRHDLPLLGVESLGGKITQNGESVIIPDVQKEVFWLEKKWARECDIHSFIAQPLRHGNEVIGVINCMSRVKGLFGSEDLDLLGTLSSQAAVAIKNARLFEESERRGDRLTTLVEVAQRLTRGLNLSEVLEVIANQAGRIFQGETILRLIEGEFLVPITGTEQGFPLYTRREIPIRSSSINGFVAQTGTPYVTSDVGEDGRASPDFGQKLKENGLGSIMAVPLRLESRVLGVLNIYREVGHVFDEAAIHVAMSLADQAAIAIENARLHEEEQKSRKFLNSLLDTAADAIITIDENGAIESFNRTAERMFGYSEGEIVGSNLSRLIPGHFRGDDLRSQARLLTGAGQKASGRRKNGLVFPVELAVSEVRVDGKLKFTGILRDVTDRVRNEEALARLNQSLDEKNKDLETVFNVASHDLRSPLVNIQGYGKELGYMIEAVRSAVSELEDIDSLREKLKVYLEEEVPETLQYISAGASKMDQLLSGLLRYSRLGYAALNIQPVDMNEMMKNISASMEYQLKEAGAVIEVDDLPECVTDAIQINQVFTNLLDNAVKYLDPDRPGLVHVSGKSEEGRSVYCVRDNGIGIKKGYEKKIFEIFHRLNHAAVPGEGLGLAITLRILDRLDGKIWMDSEYGKGSEFYVSLPTVLGG